MKLAAKTGQLEPDCVVFRFVVRHVTLGNCFEIKPSSGILLLLILVPSTSGTIHQKRNHQRYIISATKSSTICTMPQAWQVRQKVQKADRHSPDALANLELRDIPKPVPGPGEALIRIHAGQWGSGFTIGQLRCNCHSLTSSPLSRPQRA